MIRYPPQAIKLPSGETATLPASAGKVRTFSPVRPFPTTATHAPVESLTEVTMNASSGEKTIWLTLVWNLVSDSMRRSSFPVFASQIRTVPSQEDVAIDLPSAEYATEVRR